VDNFLNERRCARCGKSEDYVNLDKHHEITASKGGKKLIDLCRECHQWVHNHPKEAEEKGWYVSDYRIDK
jgi:hypothetical protein